MFGSKKKRNDHNSMFLWDLEREKPSGSLKQASEEPPRTGTSDPAPEPKAAPKRRPVRDLPARAEARREDLAQPVEAAKPAPPRHAVRDLAEPGLKPAAEKTKPAAAPENKPPVREGAVDIFAVPEPAADDDPAHPFGATAFVESFREQSKTAAKPRRARRDMRREEKKAISALSRSGRLREYIRGDEEKAPEKEAENGVAAELKEMYAPENAGKRKGKRKLTPADYVRYAVLFLCIFGFFTAAYFVVNKLYDYYRGSSLYKGLADIVTTRDRFADDYLRRSQAQPLALTIEDVYNGRAANAAISGSSANEDELELIAKIARLKEINPDTMGWIKIDNTVVNYPVMWSKIRNYYLRRDFYGKNLGAGAIFMDERNSTKVAENRNTVVYGHNMGDGSMFASLHDFASASVFYNATIRLATPEGIFVYKPFSVHRSDAYDNYFETDFKSDKAFEEFLGDMASISMFESEQTVDRSSRIITLSTCVSTTVSNNDRFVVQGVLVDVIR
ncbi:MAG: class B sortase [Clostridia bacterium]|nr:class B sortase [Clostridia bacterium]